MTNTARSRIKTGYTRPQTTDDTRNWRDLFDNPDKWESREEVEAHIDKISALVSEDSFESYTVMATAPKKVRYEEPTHPYAMIITKDCRDQLLANGYTHFATFRKRGYEFYLFVFTWDLNADLVNYFEYGIDYTTRSVL